MRNRVLPYKQGSKGAAALAAALNGRVLKLTASTFVQRPSDRIINWGNTNEAALPPISPTFNTTNEQQYGVFNRPSAIRAASNKLLFFNTMREAGLADLIPRFWTTAADIPADAYPIVCRTVLAGHSGEGIVIANSPDQLVSAPLYVQYVKKKDEYRVHVGKRYELGDGDHSDVQPGLRSIIIDRQQKRRRHDHDSPNWQVRNHANGFIYARNDVIVPDAALTAACRAFMATDLTFGAVDVIWNDSDKRAYVLEINTAPGLEGQTVLNYANFFLTL